MEIGEFGLHKLVVGDEGRKLGAGVSIRKGEGEGGLHDAVGEGVSEEFFLYERRARAAMSA